VSKCVFYLKPATLELPLLASSMPLTLLARHRDEEMISAQKEVKFEFLKSILFVVAVFIWPNRVVIIINMHQDATRSSKWPLGGKEVDKNHFYHSKTIYTKDISI